jgi:hypothetical protein
MQFTKIGAPWQAIFVWLSFCHAQHQRFFHHLMPFEGFDLPIGPEPAIDGGSDNRLSNFGCSGFLREDSGKGISWRAKRDTSRDFSRNTIWGFFTEFYPKLGYKRTWISYDCKLKSPPGQIGFDFIYFNLRAAEFQNFPDVSLFSIVEISRAVIKRLSLRYHLTAE